MSVQSGSGTVEGSEPICRETLAKERECEQCYRKDITAYAAHVAYMKTTCTSKLGEYAKSRNRGNSAGG